MPEELPLEPDLIKVLAADTRREILSLLQERRMTVTELSRELDLGKATVHEHLNKLTDAGLVEREEDDRLWVYYRLTGRGKRLLNPQRTRFYLALASALVAALVAGLAVYGFMMTGGVGTMDETSQVQTAVLPTEQEVYADDAIEVPARVEGDGDVQTYLVDEDSASRIREGDLSVQGLPMHASASPSDTAGDVQARDNTTLLRADASLEPGTYYLYVRGEGGDNAGAMPSIQLVGLEASTDRSTWYQGLDEGPLEINLTREGQPVNGSLRLAGGPQAGTSPVTPVETGAAAYPEDTLDELPPGTYHLSVQPEDTERWITLPESLTLTRPALATVPLHVSEGDPHVRVHLDGPSRLQASEPTVSGANASLRSLEDGWALGLGSVDPGSLTVELARTATTVEVHPSLAIETVLHDGPEVHWSLKDQRGEPVEDAAIRIDGASLGFTDANGTLVSDVPAEGTHRLDVHRPDGHTITRALTVDGWQLQAPPASIAVDPVDVASEGGTARLTVDVRNEGPVDEPVTLVAHVDASPSASQALEVPAGQTEQIEVTVPADSGRQQVAVDAVPLTPGPFAFTNETSGGDEETEDDTEGDAGATTEDADDATAAESIQQPGRATFELPSQPVADGAADGDAAGPLEPIDPAEGAAMDESAETPVVGPLATALAVGLTAAATGRARKP